MSSVASEAFVDYLDQEMAQVVVPGTRPEALAKGFRFIEGPVWVAGQDCLLFSDIPNNRIHRWSESGVTIWCEPSNHANGNTVDRQGRIITCEHETRVVSRSSFEGDREVIASEFQGKRLNSPNDVVVRSDGTVWFTDPPYAIKAEQQEQEANHVFRLNPESGELRPVISDFSRPNGLCFSPDESMLYIAEADRERAYIRRFRLDDETLIEDQHYFARIQPGIPDGMRVDRDGRLYSTAADGVHVYRADGTLIGRIRTPSIAANCAFGGPEGNKLFVTATDTLWRVPLATALTPLLA